MNTKNVVLGGVAVVAFVFASLFFAKTPVVVVQSDGEGQVVPVQVAGVPTLDGVNNPYVNINGVGEYYYSQNMLATSSFPCAVKNPFSSTSTLKSFSARVSSNGIASAQKISLATSSTQYGSSTPAIILDYPAPAGQFSMVLKSVPTTATVIGTNASGYSNLLIAPNEWLTLRVATGTPGTYAGGYYTGRCEGVFEEL